MARNSRVSLVVSGYYGGQAFCQLASELNRVSFGFAQDGELVEPQRFNGLNVWDAGVLTLNS